MPDYHQKNYKAYHEKTFFIDPSSFIEPLAKRLPAESNAWDEVQVRCREKRGNNP
jgi:hypothetical protein